MTDKYKEGNRKTKMGIVLSVHSVKAFREYLLPSGNNMDYSIILSKDIFKLERDVKLYLEIVEGNWSFCKTEEYCLEEAREKKDYFGQTLKNDDLLTLILPGNERLSLMVEETDSSFCVFEKYDIGDRETVSIGQGEENDIRYDKLKLVSRNHAIIHKNKGRYILEDRSANGVFVNSVRIVGNRQLEFGDSINIFGLSMVFLAPVLAVNIHTENVSVHKERLKNYCMIPEAGKEIKEKKSFYHRSPRQIYRLAEDAVEIEAPPQPKELGRKPLGMLIGPSLTMALPMLLGSGLAIYSTRAGGSSGSAFMYTGLITALSSAVIGAVWALLNLRLDKKKNREEELHRFEAYGEYLIKCANDIKEKYEKNAESLKTMYLSAENCSRFDENNSMLWNRNADHEDFLCHRVGIGDMPFQAAINIPKERFTLINDSLAEKPRMIQQSYKTLHDVPICVDLMQHRLVGVIGGEKKQGGVEVIHNLVAQLAVSNCYTDVKMAFIYEEGEDESDSWEYMKWLPHVWSEDKKTRFIARNKSEAGDVLYEITKALRIRAENSSYNKKKVDKPYYILFVASPELLEGELITKYIYEENENQGLTTVFLVDCYEKLPNACNYIIQNDASFQGIYDIADDMEEKIPIQFDRLSDMQLEQLARKLSDIEVNESETGGDIPALLSFFDMYGVDNLEDLCVMDRWRKNRTYNSMKALIGQKAGEMPWYLDIHEKYHGPHGLIAGTTGSGKSETLQTYILSLALNFSPDDVGFFIIDYKGGGMANLFENLPHMIGQISNLSGNQVKRAMVAIKSENRRRQRIFNEYGVNNINLYTRLYKDKEASVPIPHMFIIIDEFAELKREEPDFMRELISVAQVGRSLGVHLILATQKPGGTVDDNIWSNSKFRLCLRVQDRQDSNDMLHRPEAAYITQAGRCYMQVGNDELFELFQSGWSGAAYEEDGAQRKTVIAKMLSLTGKAALVGKRAKTHKRKEAGQKERTQLDAVVDYLKLLAKENGYTHMLQLWLPVLPVSLYLKQLKGYKSCFDGNTWRRDRQEWNLETPVGMYDDPVNQSQDTVRLSLSQNGHHAVIGTVASGKSTFLQTFVFAMVSRYSPSDIHIYAIDFSAKMLSAFERMPHVGGIIYENENDRLAKFFNMLGGILEERKQLFRGGNYSQYVRVNGIVLPAILLVIDNYANFRSKTNNIYEDMILQLSKDGVNYGIFLIITAGGFGTLEIPIRIGDNLRTVICLEMNDKYQYAEALRTAHIETLPETNIKGRGLVRTGEEILEFQTALAFEAEDDFKRMDEIQALAEQMRNVWEGRMARPIPEIPEHPVWQEFIESEESEKLLSDDRHIPIGYNFKNAAPYGVDLSRIYCYLIAGKARSGKTNLMKVLLYSTERKGGKSVVIDFGGEFTCLAEKLGAVRISSDEELFQFFSDLLPDFKNRNIHKKECIQKGMSDEEIYLEMKQFEPLYLFLADFTDFVQHVTCSAKGNDAQPFIENLLDKGSLHNVFWFACCNYENLSKAVGTRLYEYFLKYKTGIHFGGNVAAQRIMNFDYVPYAEQSKALKPGIAMLPSNEEEDVRKVIIPLVKS